MSVGEICNREVIICQPDESVSEAVGLMHNLHVGSVVVVEKRHPKSIPLGILTDRDILLRLVHKNIDIHSSKVRDVMSGELITANQDDEIIDTIELMRDKGIRRMPIVNHQGELEGILTVDDLVDFITEQLTDLVRLCRREIQHEQATS